MNLLKNIFKKKNKTVNLDKYKGEYGIVLETIDNDNNVGSIVIEGKILNALSENDEVIYKDKKVVITNIIDEIAYVVEFNR